MRCVISERSDFVPLIHCSVTELNNLNSLDSINLIDSLPNDEVHHLASQNNQLLINDDMDECTVDSINSKYYTCSDFFNMHNENSFNLFHSNVNGYLGKADNLQEFIGNDSIKTEFDVICVTETSLSDADVIPNNAKLAGYNEPFVSNTLTSRGGVAIFAKTSNALERSNLKVQDVEFEATWIEINNLRSKNIIVGCLYRHSHNNNTEQFFEYLNKCLSQLIKENNIRHINAITNSIMTKHCEWSWHNTTYQKKSTQRA